MKILLVDQDEVLSQKAVIFIEQKIKNIKVIAVKTAKDGLNIVQNSTTLIAVISDFATLEGNGGEIYNYIKNNGLNIPFIWLSNKSLEGLKQNENLSNFEKDHPGNSYINKHMCFDLLESTLKSSLEKRGEFVESVKKGSEEKKEGNNSINVIAAPTYPIFKDYVRINVKRFFFRNNNEFDIYSFDDKNSFIKIWDKKTSTASDMLKCRRTYPYFYISGKEYKEYIPHYIENIKNAFLSNSENLELKIDYQIHLLSLVHDVIQQMGSSKDVHVCLKSATESIYNLFQDSQSYWPIFSAVHKGKDYLLEKSLMTAYFSIPVVRDLDENPKQNCYNIIFSSLIHAIPITYHDHLWKVHQLDDPLLTLEDKSRLKEGAYVLSSQLSGCEFFNPQVFEIIDYFNGDNKQSNLQMVFKMSQDFAELLLGSIKKPDPALMDQYISILHQKYSGEIYKKAVNSVLNSVVILVDELN